MKVLIHPAIEAHHEKPFEVKLKRALCPNCYTGYIIKTKTGEFICISCLNEVIIEEQTQL